MHRVARHLTAAVLVPLRPPCARSRLHRTRPLRPPCSARAMASVYDPDNIFKKILDGKVPCYKIFETEHALAFLDAFPMAEGHSLLIPKATGYADIYDMPPDVAASVLRELPRLAKAVQAATGCEGVNIVQNNGKAAGQVVFHLHFHVIPRVAGDGLIKLGAHGASGGMIDPAVAARGMLPSSEPPPTWVIKARDAVHAARAKGPLSGGAVALSIISWNVQLLWPQAGALPFRAACIADRLLALGADVVCLQECWDARSRAVLLDKLRPAYQHVYQPAAFAKCGLLLLSKACPLQNCVFYRFQGATGAERHLFDKGALGAMVMLPGDGTEASPSRALAVVNTHTQSDFWGDCTRARTAQMVELKGLLNDLRYAASVSGVQLVGTLLCGDLNIRAGTPEQWAACKLLGFPPPRDLCDTDSTASFPLGVWKGGRYVRRIPGCRLDYILDCSACLGHRQSHPGGADPGRLPDAATPQAGVMSASAYVELECAQQLDAERRRCDTGGLLSDHSPVLGVVSIASCV